MSRKQHLSRLAIPATWPIKRKGIKWIVKQIPGPHNLEYSMPLLIFLRDVLKICANTDEVKKVLNRNAIKINNKIVREKKFPVGLFDTISIPELGKHWRISINKQGKLAVLEISENEAKILPVKIISKKTIRGGRTQLHFNNGWTTLNDNKEYKIGDVLILDLTDKSIKDHIKQTEGALVFVIKGKLAGELAKLKELKKIGILKKEKIAVLEKDEKLWETPEAYIFPVGEKEVKFTVR